jgi:hypothetical protein
MIVNIFKPHIYRHRPEEFYFRKFCLKNFCWIYTVGLIGTDQLFWVKAKNYLSLKSQLDCFENEEEIRKYKDMIPKGTILKLDYRKKIIKL